MRRLAAGLFALWLVTAYLLVFARAESRYRAKVIEGQAARIEGAEHLLREVLAIYNRTGRVPR